MFYSSIVDKGRSLTETN